MIRRAGKEDISSLLRLMQFVQDLHSEAHPEIFTRQLDPSETEAFFEKLLSNER